MSRRFLGIDPISGVEEWWHEDGEGNWAIETSQSGDWMSALFDMNANARNHCDPNMRGGTARCVARIPRMFMAKLRNEMGIDYYSLDPDEQKVINKLLNSNEYYKLRTDGSNL